MERGDGMIRLHHAAQSRSMRVLWLLHEIDEPFTVKLWPFDKTLRSPEFLALNPSGRVPALEFNGRHIWESSAIVQTLCMAFPQAGLAPHVGHPQFPDWLIWLNFAETISQHSAALTQQHVVLREDHMRSPIITQLEPRRLQKCYAALEARLAGRDWLVGGFSAADVACGQALYMARHFATTDGFDLVTDWYARLSARPAFQAALPKEGEPLLYHRDFYPPLP